MNNLPLFKTCLKHAQRFVFIPEVWVQDWNKYAQTTVQLPFDQSISIFLRLENGSTTVQYIKHIMNGKETVS